MDRNIRVSSPVRKKSAKLVKEIREYSPLSSQFGHILGLAEEKTPKIRGFLLSKTIWTQRDFSLQQGKVFENRGKVKTRPTLLYNIVKVFICSPYSVSSGPPPIPCIQLPLDNRPPYTYVYIYPTRIHISIN